MHDSCMTTSHATRKQRKRRPRIIVSGSALVKIYEGKNRGKPLFTVAWHIGPRRHRVCFQDLKAAEQFARSRAELLRHGDHSNARLTPAEIETFHFARQKLQPIGVPLHVAAEEYAAAIVRLKGVGSLREAVDLFVRNYSSTDGRITVRKALDEFLEMREKDGVGRRYLEDCRNRIGRFANDFKIAIRSVTARDIDDWLRRLSCGPRSRNNFRALIVTLFSFAQKRGYLPKDRPHEAIQVEKAKVRGTPIVIFTPAELTEMLAVAEGRERIALCIGAFTGIRQAEMLRLKWEDFNWAEEVIDLGEDQTKTASRRLVPILPATAAWLDGFKQERGPVLSYGSEKALGVAYKAIVGRVNAARPEGQRDFAWKRNGLRHSYASYRLAEIQDAAKVSLEMGNSPQKIFNNYRKVVTKSQAAAWFGVMPTVPENVVPISAVA